jgi:monoterpene epsilon-lactone hydrolase
MPSLSTRLFNAAARRIIKPVFTEFDVKKVRRIFAQIDKRIPDPKGVSLEVENLPHCNADWLSPDNLSSNRVILYFPGGAWVLRSQTVHRRIVAKLVKLANAKARLVFYRLAPEHPFPAPLEDCVDAYRDLLDRGIPPSRIVIGGDSAGGHLTLATLLALRDEGLPLPAAAFALSPATDMHQTPTGSRLENATLDPVFPMSSDYGDQDPRRMFVGGREELFDHPYVSPVRADLEGLCPIFIQVGSNEILLDDSTKFVAKARAAGVSAEVEVWDGQPHVWQAMFFPESGKAMEQVADFIRHHCP